MATMERPLEGGRHPTPPPDLGLNRPGPQTPQPDLGLRGPGQQTPPVDLNLRGLGQQTPPADLGLSRPGQQTPPADLGLSRSGRQSKGLQRAGSLRLRGEERREILPTLRRERTDDSLGEGRVSSNGGTPLRRSQSTRSFAPAGPRAAPHARPTLEKSSSVSSDCIARNGTTFSSRCNKYVVHCSKWVDDEHYLTPTQRTARDLKRLRALLDRAYDTIRQRDGEISRLRQELRRGSAPEQEPPASPGSGSGSGSGSRLPSVCDSGACDCVTPPGGRSGEEAPLELEARLGGDWEATERWIECEERRLRDQHEERVAELNRQHAAEYHEMKEKYNDKVEGLLQKLTEANTRYFELRPQYDAACLRLRQLELAVPAAGDGRDCACQTADPNPAALPPPTAELTDQLRRRERQLDTIRGYWDSMFSLPISALGPYAAAGLPGSPIDAWTATTLKLQQGIYQQQLAALEASRDAAGDMDASTRLQFLRSAVFHLLTARDDYAGHLTAIAAVLRFSPTEVQEVERARARRLGHA